MHLVKIIFLYIIYNSGIISPALCSTENILNILLKSLIAIPRNREDVKILTSDKFVKNAVLSNPDLEGVDICSSLIDAIDAFFGKKGLEKLTSNQDLVHEIFLSTQENYETTGIIDLNFRDELKEPRN